MTTNEGGDSGVCRGPPAVFPDDTQGPTFERTSMARGVDGAVHEKTSSEYDEPPLRQKIPRKSSRSMSADIETDDEDEFAADLYYRLQEEAKY